MTFANL